MARTLPFGFFLTESDLKILKGHLPTLPIQMKKDAPQLPPAPKGKTFRQKVNKEAETFDQ